MDVDKVGLDDFLLEYPGMSVIVDLSSDLVLRGEFEFSARFKNDPEVRDVFSLEIRVPEKFPAGLPTVKELAGKVPRDGKHHINPDNTLCLGSPLRLRTLIVDDPTLPGFAVNCIVPFLYWISSKKFAAGELEHGKPGVIADYTSLFVLSDPKQVVLALKLLGMKRRQANKKPCPCGCGKRFGKCNYRFLLNCFRDAAPRWWYRAHLLTLGTSSR